MDVSSECALRSDENVTKKTYTDPWSVTSFISSRLRAKLIRKYGTQLTEDIWTDVVLEKTPRLVETYDESKGVSIEAYFYMSLLWYAHKYVVARNAHAMAELPENKLRSTPSNDAQHETIANLNVADMLQGLNEFDRYIVYHITCMGETITRLAGIYKVGVPTMLRWHKAALARLRELRSNLDVAD